MTEGDFMKFYFIINYEKLGERTAKEAAKAWKSYMKWNDEVLAELLSK